MLKFLTLTLQRVDLVSCCVICSDTLKLSSRRGCIDCLEVQPCDCVPRGCDESRQIGFSEAIRRPNQFAYAHSPKFSRQLQQQEEAKIRSFLRTAFRPRSGGTARCCRRSFSTNRSRSLPSEGTLESDDPCSKRTARTARVRSRV